MIPEGYKCNQWGWFWKEDDNSGPYFLDKDGRMCQGLPSVLLTDFFGEGESPRLRVDPGQTGFFAGREFFTFKEFTLTGNATITLKAVAPLPVILHRFEIDAFAETLRVEWSAGGTETAPFVDSLPIFRTNQTKNFDYMPQVVMTANGTVTGGTLLDVLELGATKKGESAVNASESPLGFAPGTWYIRIKNLTNQQARGVFKARWEERPAGA